MVLGRVLCSDTTGTIKKPSEATVPVNQDHDNRFLQKWWSVDLKGAGNVGSEQRQ
jgi:hypothetical protein